MPVIPVQFDVNQMAPNDEYVYSVTPVGHNGAFGHVQSFTIDALSALYNVSVVNYDSSSTVFSLSGAFQYVNVVRNGIVVNPRFSGNIYIDSGLVPDTSYAYVFTPYNHVDIASTAWPEIDVRTLTGIYSAIYTSDISSINITINGVYNYVDIYNNMNPVVFKLYDTSFTDLSVSVDSAYTYTIIPHDINDVSGVTYTLNAGTQPQIYDISYVNTSNTITLNVSGSYSNYSVNKNGAYIDTVSGPYFVDISGGPGLRANTSYSYIITPYNTNAGLNISGSPSTSINIVTLPVVNSLAYTTDPSSITLSINGLYSYVSITRNDAVIVSTLNDISYTDTGLTPDVSYTYAVTPYNIVNVNGQTSSIVTTTASIIYTIYPTYDSSSVTMNISGSYAYVDISRNGRIIVNSLYDISYTDTDISGGISGKGSGLLANQVYSYSIIPHNWNGLIGKPYSFIIDTLPTITNVTYTSTVHTVTLTVSGYYAYYSLFRNGIDISNNITKNTYRDTGLSPDICYNYVFVPHNMYDVCGTPYKLYGAETLPEIYNIQYVSTDPSSITLTLSGGYTYFNVSRNGVLVDVSMTGTIYIDRNHGQGLPADASYNYSVKPYNSRYFAGNAYVLSIDTLPILFNIGVTTYDTSSVTLSISGIYDYVNVFRNGASLAQRVTASNYYDNGLLPNTTYIYRAVPYNSNDISGSAIEYNFTTLPSLYALKNTYTTNSITLSISGSYQTVNILRGNAAIVSRLNDISYTDTTVFPNNTYTYNVIPYNTVGVSGSISAPLAVITLPTIYTASYVSTINSATLSISGAYQTVVVKRNNTTIITGLNDISYTDTGLLPDVSYVYSIVPFNTNNIQGNTYSFTAETYPQLSSVTLSTITTSSIAINVSGAYIYFDVSRNGIVIAAGIYDVSYTDTSGLSPNVDYRYGIRPYNAIGFIGSVLYTPTTSPLGYVNFTNYSSQTTSSIVVNFTGPATYNYVKVARITNGNVVSAYSKLTVGDISFSDTGLVPYNSYTYNIIPYNVLNVANGSITTPAVSVVPTVTFVGYSNITTSAVTITFSSAVNYSYVKIARITNGVMGAYITLAIGATTYIDTGLSAAKSYTYSIQPYNAANAAGTAITTPTPVVVLPYVTFANFTNGTSNSVQINFNDATTYSYLQVARILNGSIGMYQQLSPGDTSYNDVGLILSNIYSYSAIPYNLLGVSGPMIVTPYNSSYASVNFSGNLTALSASSISIPFTGQYINATIFNGYMLKSNISTSPYVFNSLLPNTQYTFTVTPYNSANVAGTPISGNSYTWGLVTVLNPVSTIGALTIGVSGSFYSATWTNDTTNATGTLPYGSPYVINDTSVTATEDVSYSYTIVPYNNDGVAASGFGVFRGTVYSAATISNYNATPMGSSITITASGSFYYIGWRNNVTNLTGFSAPGTGIFTDASGIIGNSVYTYTLTPYTLGSTPCGGNTVVTTSSIYTWGAITGITPTVTGNTIAVSVSGSYTRFNWTNTNTGTTGSAAIGVTNFVDVSGLSPNIGYTYNIVPYNASNTVATGAGIFSQTVYTLGNIVSAVASTVQSIFIVITVSGNFTTVGWKNNITQLTGNVTAAGNYIAGSEVVSFYDASLNSTTNYTYTLIPYNYIGAAGPPFTTGTIRTSSYSYYVPGLQWTIYANYFSDDVTFGTSPNFQFYPGNTGYAATNEGAYTGYTSNLNGLVNGTNGNIIGNGGNWHTFSCEWIGYFYTQTYGGTWTFTTSSDDGSYLWIGAYAASGWTTSNATVNNGGLHGQRAVNGTATLTANTYYPIRIQFGENGGGFEMITTFQRPDGTSFTDATGYLFSLNNINATLTFQIKPISASMPTLDNTGIYTLTNYSGVSVVTDPAGGTRKKVFQFNGSNSLTIGNVPITQNSTLTFWVYSSTPSSGTGLIYNLFNIFSCSFGGTNNLKALGGMSSSVAQTAGGTYWKFYAITTTATSVAMYMNANITPVATASFSYNPANNTTIEFGNGFTGYLDDMRYYPSVLNTTQLFSVYTGSDLYFPYQFRMKPLKTMIDTVDNTRNCIVTNTGNVIVVNDPVGTRGYVYQFNGSNYLSVNVTTYYNGSTKTFWVYSATPNSNNGNVFSSYNYPVWFSGTTNLGASPGSPSGSARIQSTYTQGAAWTFYAITSTKNTVTIYINGNTTPNVTGTVNNWTADDTNPVQLGAYNGANNYTGYLDDIRLYNSVLTPAQISAIYNGTDISVSSTGGALPTDISSNVIVLTPYATSSTAITIPFYGIYNSITIYNGTTSYNNITSSPYSYTGLSPNTSYSFSLTSYDSYGVIGNTMTTGNIATLPTLTLGAPYATSTTSLAVPFTGAYKNATLSYVSLDNGLQWTSYSGYFNNNLNYISKASSLTGINNVNKGTSTNLTSLATATNNTFVNNLGTANAQITTIPFSFRIKPTSGYVPTMDNTGSYSITATGNVQTVSDPTANIVGGGRGYVLYFPNNSAVNYLTLNGYVTPATVSLTMWVYNTTYNTGEFCFLDHIGGGSTGPIPYIRCEYYTGQFHVVLNYGGDIFYNWQRPTFYPANKWMFYTVTINATTINVYVNTILVSTTILSTYTNFKFNGSNANIIIGARGDYAAPFTGYLDDIRYYPVVLTQSQINSIYYGTDISLNTSYNPNNFTIQWLGLLYTQSYTGNWNFSIAADDVGYMWLGNKAITNYTIANSDISAVPQFAPFNPTKITGCLLWLDATDPNNTGITPSNGTSISVWYDKSGKNNNTNYKNGTSSVIVGNGINTYSAIQLQNTGFTGPITTAYTGNTFTFFIVMNTSNNPSNKFNYGRILSFGDGTSTNDGNTLNDFVFTQDWATINYILRRNSQQTGSSNLFLTNSTNYIISGYFDGTNLYYGVNGTYTTSFASSGNFNISKYGIAMNTYSNGEIVSSICIGEVLGYGSLLSISNRQSVEGYLAWKWGLQTSLPSSHPYYASAPKAIAPTNGLGTTTLALTANTYYPLRILYSQSVANYSFAFSMTPPGQSAISDGIGYFFSNNQKLTYNLATINNITSSPYRITNSQPNTPYLITMTPYNVQNISGSVVSTSYATYTVPDITYTSMYPIAWNTMYISLSGNYNYYSITNGNTVSSYNYLNNNIFPNNNIIQTINITIGLGGIGGLGGTNGSMGGNTIVSFLGTTIIGYGGNPGLYQNNTSNAGGGASGGTFNITGGSGSGAIGDRGGGGGGGIGNSNTAYVNGLSGQSGSPAIDIYGLSAILTPVYGASVGGSGAGTGDIVNNAGLDAIGWGAGGGGAGWWGGDGGAGSIGGGGGGGASGNRSIWTGGNGGAGLVVCLLTDSAGVSESQIITTSTSITTKIDTVKVSIWAIGGGGGGSGATTLDAASGGAGGAGGVAYSTWNLNQSSLSSFTINNQNAIYNSLDANKSYNFSITPYNILNVSGTTIITGNVYTMGNIIIGNVSNMPNSVNSLRIDFSGVFTNISINGIVGNIVSPYIVTGLTANTGYTYNLIPYNVVGISGAVYTTTIAYTLPTVNVVQLVASNTGPAITISLTGSYAYVSINNNAGIIRNNVYGSSYTFVGLSYNTPYIFTITPYNPAGTPGIPINTVPIYTTTLLSLNVNPTVIDAYDISINFTGNFYSVNINNGAGMVRGNIAGPYYTFNGLSANSPYSFTVIPYNGNSIVGQSSITNTVYTWGNAIIKPITDISTNYINFPFDGSYSWVNISINGNTYSNITVSPYKFSNLNASTAYNFAITPYNVYGVAGNTLTNTTYTLPYATIGNMTDGSSVNILSIPFSGVFGNVSISNGAGTTINGITTSPYQFGGLVLNTQYTFSITPYNGAGVAGLTFSKTVIYIAKYINELPYSSYSDVSLTYINIPFVGSYNTVSIGISGGSTTTGISTSPYKFTGLSPNTVYTFAITPYDSGNNRGNPISSTVGTLATIAGVSAVATASNIIAVSYGGSNASVGMATYQVDASRNPTITGITSSPYNYTNGLLPNTQYAFYVYPYNSLGMWNYNDYAASSLLYTWGTILTTTFTGRIQGGAISITGTVVGYFTSFYWKNMITGTVGGPVIGPDNAIFTDNTGLSAGLSYRYNIMPINADGLGPAVFGNSGTFTTTTIGMQYPAMSSLTTSAYNSCQGAYACFLLNSNYNGPIMQLRNSNDTYSSAPADFYSDPNGNLTTRPFGEGIPLKLWLTNQNYAYVIKWYDQSNITANHATQYVTANQPIYDVSNGFLNFGYSGVGGGYVGTYNSGAYFNLPNYALPYNDCSFSYITRVGNIMGTNSYALFVGGGGSAGASEMYFGTRSTLTQLDYYCKGQDSYYSYTWTPGTVVTFKYYNANAGGSRLLQLYNNGTLGTSTNPGFINTTYTSNYIGGGNQNTTPQTNSTLQGQMYYLYVFGSYLSTADQTVLEGTVMNYSTTNTGSAIVVTGKTISYTTAKLFTVNTTVSVTSVLFDFAGYFQTVSINNGAGNTITGITSSPYNFTGLLSGTPYTFTLTPYNTSGIAGNISTVSVSTPVSFIFNSVTPISSSAIQLSFSGATQTVSISNGAGLTIPGITTSPYTFNGLSPNTAYSFTLTPISYNISGTPYVTSPVYTYASLSLGTITDISSAYISIPFSGVNANVTISNGSTIIPSITTSPYKFIGLTANTGYTFSVTPYNAANVAGNTLATPQTYTLPTVTAGSPATINSVSVNVPFTGLFDSVTIDNSAGIVNSGIFASPYTFMGLNANTQYVFNITPYNIAGATGTISTTTSIYTSAVVAPGTPTPVSGSTDMSIPFSGSFTNVTIATTNGITYTGITSSPYQFTGLADNTQYTFVITPYNGAGVAGTSVYTSSVYTNAKLLTKSATTPTATTITITTTGNDKSLSISNGFGTIVSGITNTPYVFTGLTPNTGYTFAITPYNNSDVAGISGNTTTVYTLGTVALGTITDISDTYVSIPFTGINANISISNGLGTTINSITTSPYKFANLTANTTYNFTLTPYNVSNIAGNTVSTGSIVTLPTSYAGQPSDLSSTAISVPFTGIYNNVSISNNAGSTVTGITSSPYAFTGLSPNTSYTFSIVPYNSIGISGATSTSSGLYTWAYVMAGTPVPVTGGTSLSIPFTGTYANVSIQSNTGTTVNNITSSPYVFNGLSPNTAYSFTITPYNNSSVAGTPSVTPSVATYPTVVAGTPTDISASAISLPFSGAYTNVSISNGAGSTVTGITSSPYIFQGLSANTSYTFSIVPYNVLGVSGSTVTTTPIYTWGYVVAGTPYDVSGTTSIAIPFTGTFSKVSISNGSTVYNNITTSPYIFDGLGEYVQYTFTITPYNASSDAGFTSSTIPIYSGVTSSVTAGTPIDVSGTTSILVPFTGSYSTVSISNNAGNTVTGITSSPYTFTGLSANTFYTFTITPYDSSGIPALTSTTSTICSEAVVNPGSPSIVNGTTSISIPFSGTYTNISISNGTGTTVTGLTVSPYVFSGLTANTQYTFSLNAYNQSGTMNNAVYTSPIYTAATLYNNASTLNIATTTIDVSYSGVFGNVSISNGSTVNYTITTSPYRYTGLLANTAYTFTVTPYNAANVAGNVITTSSTYTLPAVSVSTPTDISINYISVPFAATTTGSFTNVSISNGAGSTVTGITTSPYKFTGLTANTPYTFTVTPYGAGGASGTPVSTSSIYTSAQVSAGTPTDVSATTISVPFSATTAGSFTSVSISNGSSTVTGITSSPYLFGGLTANTSYTFTITPINASSATGMPVTTTPLYTWAYVNVGTLTDVSATSISIPFSASTVGSFTKVSISNGAGVTVPGITTSPYQFNGLTANTSYTFTITPINADDVSGVGVTTTPHYTWPYVNSGTITDVSATTLSIPFTASTLGSFTNVSISNGAGTTVTSITTSPYSFGGLTANTAYTFTVTPYNASSVAGNPVTYASRTTLPYVNAGTPSDVSATSISVPFSASTVGSFTKVSISNGAGVTVPGITSSPYRFDGLTANTSYTFTITPINSLNISGSPVTTTPLYTWAYVNTGTITDVSATTLSIPFTASTAGSFTNVSISNGAGTTINNITTSPYSFGGLTANTSYTFTITPYNASSVAGNPMTYAARTTWPYVNVGTPTTSSYSTISIPFSASTASSFTSVSISNGTLTVPGITTSPYSFTGLTANTSYIFTITPINAVSVSGNAVNTTALYTLGSVTNTYYDPKTTMSSIVGDVSGKFNYISWTNQTYSGNTGTVTYNATIGGAVFTDSGTSNALAANTQYTYSIYPYNSAGTPVIGALTSFSAYTLGKVTGANNRVSTSASVTVDVSGVYSSISWTNTTSANTGTGIYSAGIGGTTFSDTGATNSLSPNTAYSYSIVPVNVSSYNGAAYTSLTAYTLASISTSASNFYISSVNTTSATLTWATNATFSKVSIALVTGATSPNLTGGSVGSYTTKLTTDTSHTASTLSYNTYYYFSIIPYNTNNVASGAVTSYAGAYTWGYISSVTPTATAYNTISVAFAGTFTTVGMATVAGTPTVTGITTSPYSYSTGLSANTAYTFYVYPYNASSVYNSTNYLASSSVYTWGSISSASYSSTASAITVTVAGTFSSVNWKNNSTGTTGSATGTNSVTFTDSTSLSASTGYTYTLAPMNASGLGPATTNGLSGTTTTATFSTSTNSYTIISYNNWASLMTLNHVSGYTAVITGSAPDQQVQLGNSAGGTLNTLTYNSAIQNYSNFTLYFEIYALSGISNPADGLFCFIGSTTTTSIWESGGYGSFNLDFQFYTANGARNQGIYLQNPSGWNGIVGSYYTSGFMANAWQPVYIYYNKGTTNTWSIWWNGTNVINYSDPNNASYIASAGNYWGFGFRDGGAVETTYVRHIKLTTNINISYWTPLQVSGLQLWLDANDPFNNSTMPAATWNGSVAISTWYDKSGYGRNATAVNSPTFSFMPNPATTTIGSTSYYGGQQCAINFNGTNQYLYGSVPITGSTISVFAVATVTSSSTTNNARMISFSNGLGTNDYNNNSYFGFLRQSNTGLGPYRNVSYINNNPPNYNTPYLWECWYDGTSAYASTCGGGQVAQQSISNSSTTGNFAITTYAVGSHTNTADGTGYMTGSISEILVFNTVLSTADRQSIEGYLSWKWGMQSFLPSNHPYYSVPPSGSSSNVDFSVDFSKSIPVVVLGSWNQVGTWTGNPGGDTTGYWVWNIGRASSNCAAGPWIHFYKQMTFGTAFTGTMWIICDNYSYFFMNGIQQGNSFGGNWNSTGTSVSINVPAGTVLFDIFAVNGGGPGGLIASLYNGSTLVMHTDPSWTFYTTSTTYSNSNLPSNLV